MLTLSKMEESQIGEERRAKERKGFIFRIFGK